MSALDGLLDIIDSLQIYNGNARKELSDLRYRCERAEAELAQVTAERDAFVVESDMVHRNINEMCGTNTSTFEAVQHVIDERDAVREALKVYERQKAFRK